VVDWFLVETTLYFAVVVAIVVGVFIAAYYRYLNRQAEIARKAAATNAPPDPIHELIALNDRVAVELTAASNALIATREAVRKGTKGGT
jgi:membrane protein required for beta-lactamase induction